VKGALGGAVAAWLGLIALQAIGSTGGSGRVAEFLTGANTALEHLLDPAVPAIPDRRTGARNSVATGGAVTTPAAAASPPRIPVPAPASTIST
jgi:hypothetical protein